MKLNEKDMENLNRVKYNLVESERTDRWGWSPHGFEFHYGFDVRELLGIIDKLMKEEEEE